MRRLTRRLIRKDKHTVDMPPYPGTPRWAKVFGIVALIIVLLFVILMIARGPGGHGPSRHSMSSILVAQR
jgi:hypothetical protein